MKNQCTLLILALLIFVCEVESQAQTMVDTFSYTGTTQIFVVDTCIAGTISFDIRGAQGGDQSSASGGLGGRVHGSLNLNIGDTLYINVGQAGPSDQGTASGVMVGSGGVHSFISNGVSGVGGGATDIRLNGTSLNDRIVVAGGGGGAGGALNQPRTGGAGGGLIGGNGANWWWFPPGLQSNGGGKGGTQSAGGASGTAGCSVSPTSGSLGQGGQGTGDNAAGGGGGGGYYGGGGGCFSGGGGGSSYAYPSASFVFHTQGYQNGNGMVMLTYNVSGTTVSTQNIIVCNSLTSPSGLYVWSSSGTYQDTILNAIGCDSIITVHLTVQSTTSSQTLTVCNSLISPSGLYVWTSTGTYQDTLINSIGCDSIITVHLTVQSTASSQTLSVCDSLISPSGLYVWTSSGTYQDTLINAIGCDSLITVELTVQSTTSSSLALSVCDWMISPSGLFFWTSSGMYQDILPNAAGCDSLITIDLTVHTTTFSSQLLNVCDSMISPDGLEVWTSSGIYKDTIPNANGCDSVMTIDLRIQSATSSNQTMSACDSMFSPSGLYVWTNSGVYHDTISNAQGCDSLLTVDLTILESTSAYQTLSTCDRMISPSGLYVWTSSGVYHDTVSNVQGCDSLITIDLIVHTVDTAVVQSGFTLTADSSAEAYQWLDCHDSFNVLPDEIDHTFYAVENGSYAVEITENGCVDTSACFVITTVGISEEEMRANILLYPNPTEGMVHIDLGELRDAAISVFSIDGRKIHHKEQINASVYELTINDAPGIYILEVKLEHLSQRYKVIKTR